MLDILLKTDIALLLMVNWGLSDAYFGGILTLLSAHFFWAAVFTVCVIVALVRRDPDLGWLLVMVAVAVGFTDAFNYFALKPYFARLRPCHELRYLIDFSGCGGLYSFPSNHAANGMAVVGILMRSPYKLATYVLFTMVLLVSLSRVYLGVHYPADVFCGMYLGLCLGWLSSLILNRQRSKFSEKSPHP